MIPKLSKYNIVGNCYFSRDEGECEFLFSNVHTSSPFYDVNHHALEDVIVCLVKSRGNCVPNNGYFIISLFITVEGEYSTSYFDEEWDEYYSPTNYTIRMLSDEEREWVIDQIKPLNDTMDVM